MEPRGSPYVNNTIVENETHYSVNHNNSQQQTLYSGNATVGYDRGYFSGWNIPHYHRRLNAGELLPHTPYEAFKAKGRWNGTHYRHDIPSNISYRTDRNWTAVPTYAPEWDITVLQLKNIAASYDASSYVQDAAAAIYSGGWDALTFVAELRKTIVMFTSALSSLKRLLTLGNPASTWLEYRYGWRILYYDIVDIAKAIDNLEAERTRFSQRAGITHRKTEVIERPQWDGYSGFTMKIVIDDEISLRGSVTADINPPRFQVNPAITAWELIKFSFIIDWFVQIGTWLEAMSFLIFSTNYTASYGYKVTRLVTATMTDVHFGATSSGSHQGYALSSAELVWRIPSTVSHFPTIRVNVDTPKMIDLWALLSGIKPRGVRL
jgi:hypothetical protein